MKQQIYKMREIQNCELGRGPQVLGNFGMPYHEGTLSKQEKKVKKTCQRHREFCEVKIEYRECHLRYCPGITRIVEGHVNQIELEDKAYGDRCTDVSTRRTMWIDYSSNELNNLGPLPLPTPSLPHGFKEVTNKQAYPSRLHM